MGRRQNLPGISSLFEPPLQVVADLKLTRSDDETVVLHLSGDQETVLDGLASAIESTRSAWKES